jgi:3-deoxy-D-manno-octulosonate 8-phosphate phosphatase (KDO 8-P phosphatase)
VKVKADKIKLFVLDVDGVLTDAGMYYDNYENELKKFNTRDSVGLNLLRMAGIQIAIITQEKTDIVTRRAEKLRIRYLLQGVNNKQEALQGLLEKLNINFDETAYIGDDLNDIPVLQKVGLALAVADAAPQVKKLADWVSSHKGGEGAVREAAELLLESRGILDEIVENYVTQLSDSD